mmetsp:Transcript_94725/g.277057  ORF Transcript_94725/g.277057 Transcript_94725/m.277057 type:complete len:300 (-) Transcript_94725:37-936(-)
MGDHTAGDLARPGKDFVAEALIVGGQVDQGSRVLGDEGQGGEEVGLRLDDPAPVALVGAPDVHAQDLLLAPLAAWAEEVLDRCVDLRPHPVVALHDRRPQRPRARHDLLVRPPPIAAVAPGAHRPALPVVQLVVQLPGDVADGEPREAPVAPGVGRDRPKEVLPGVPGLARLALLPVGACALPVVVREGHEAQGLGEQQLVDRVRAVGRGEARPGVAGGAAQPQHAAAVLARGDVAGLGGRRRQLVGVGQPLQLPADRPAALVPREGDLLGANAAAAETAPQRQACRQAGGDQGPSCKE